MRKVTVCGAALGLVLAAGVGWAEVPVAVSPGDAEKLVTVGDACPTFSWTKAPGSSRYELVVYAAGEEEEQAREVLKETLPAGATNWTPSLERCLERGGRYAWSVRAVGEKAASDWSALRLFEVPSPPSEMELEQALEIVQRYLGGAQPDARETGGSSRVQTAVGSASPAAGSSSALAPAAGDGDLRVNGAPVVTTATFGEVAAVEDECPGALVAADRYTDCGNGTVRDNNTGIYWLRDASCADLSGTDSDGRGNWDTAEAAAVALADGTCGLTDGSTPGDWRQPTISELCSAWSGTILSPCPASAAADSLIDSTMGPPTIAAGNPFVGVESNYYWSATEVISSAARVRLLNGFVNTGSKTGNLYVWPVRGGQ